MAQILDGKIVSQSIIELLRPDVKEYTPSLEIITVGEDSASQIYVRNKIRVAEELGIPIKHTVFPANINKFDLCKYASQVSCPTIVQLPLPPHLNAREVCECIPERYDADRLTTKAMGQIMQGKQYMLSCTPSGIIDLLRYYNIAIEGKHAVVVGRSDIVGKPIALGLLHENATVTICHSRTANLSEITRMADILIVAIGKPKFITADMVKPGAVVIDVGINRDDNGKLCGDVDFDNVQHVAGAITPVPGGVGPMTVVELMCNAYMLHYENQIEGDYTYATFDRN